MKRGFTLIELLVIVAIMGTMVTVGLVSVRQGQRAARVKGATRDVYAAIRHARSIALVTGQRVLVNYSNTTVDDEVAAKIEIVAAKIMSTDDDRAMAQPYYVKNYKDLPTAVQPQKNAGMELVKAADEKSSGGGEGLDEILFSPMDDSTVMGMRILAKKDDEVLTDETAAQTRSRISVFSTVDYIQNRYKEKKAEAEKKEEGVSAKVDKEEGKGTTGVDDMVGTFSVVWQTNGSVEPHKVWVYPDGKRPQDGLMLDIDAFGAIKVVNGDGREED